MSMYFNEENAKQAKEWQIADKMDPNFAGYNYLDEEGDVIVPEDFNSVNYDPEHLFKEYEFGQELNIS